MHVETERKVAQVAAKTRCDAPASRLASSRRASSRGRSAGVVMVEYAFLLAFFGVPVMLGTAAAGIHLIQAYGEIRNDILGKGP